MFNRFYRYKFSRRPLIKFKFSKFKTLAVLISIFLLINFIIFFPHFFRSTYIVTIANKQIKTIDNKKTYLIYTQTENGDTRVFKDMDSLLELKFDSEDIYGGLRINRTYEIKTYGFRIPLTGNYENIVKVKWIKWKIHTIYKYCF